MPQHRNGKAISQPHNMWRPNSEFWSANRAEHRFADGYELVASGQAASLSDAKAACEAELVQVLAALGHPPKA